MSPPVVAKEAVRLILDGIFPPMCIGCSEEGSWLCDACLASVPFVGRVKLPMDTPLDVLTALSSYRHPIVGGLVRSFKYQRALCLEEEALQALLTKFAHLPALKEGFLSMLTMIVPLPMDPDRERIRGMDHALRLAQLIQRVLFPSVPLVRALRRTRSTQTNASLPTAAARAVNVRGIFASCERVEGEHVLLVDDVYTSGATLREAAVRLKEGGAASIQALVLAQSEA